MGPIERQSSAPSPSHLLILKGKSSHWCLGVGSRLVPQRTEGLGASEVLGLAAMHELIKWVLPGWEEEWRPRTQQGEPDEHKWEGKAASSGAPKF